MSINVAAGIPASAVFTIGTQIREARGLVWDEATSTATYTFIPDLTVAETQAFQDLVAAYRTRDVELSLTEYQAIKPDIALLKTFAGVNSPTLAQTAAATKAQSRILRALLRDG